MIPTPAIIAPTKGVAKAAAAPAELADVEPAAAELDEAAVLDEADAAVLVKALWSVMLAVNPVAFVQAEPTVVLLPETKLTAAHWRYMLVLVQSS